MIGSDPQSVWASLQMQLEAHRPDRVEAASQSLSSTPVCLVTGFLGAGKSTILAHLLSHPPEGMVVRAIVNDVGALPFDPNLRLSADTGRVELINGCGCCDRTLELAAEIRNMTADGRCDLLVLEASGAADPFAQAQVVAADQHVTLDRIVTVVTCEELLSPTRFEPSWGIAARQLSSAHCVIVSGCDRVSDDEADRACREAERRAPGCTVRRSSPAALASDMLLPSSPRGARPIPELQEFGELVVVTALQTAELHEGDLRVAIERARPRLVRAKGEVLIAGKLMAVNVTPHGVDIEQVPRAVSEGTQPDGDAGGPPFGPIFGLTLIATEAEVFTELQRLLGRRSEGTRSDSGNV